MSLPFLLAGPFLMFTLAACGDSNSDASQSPGGSASGAGGGTPTGGSSGDEASAGAPEPTYGGAAGSVGTTTAAGAGSGNATGGAPSTGGAVGFTCPDEASTAGTAAVEPSDCEVPPQDQVVGWAAVEGKGTTTTTGGGDTTPVVVTTTEEFEANIAGTEPKVVHLAGSVCGSFAIGSNKTIVGCGGKVTGHLDLKGSVNVIVRNLTIVGMDCVDSPNDCSEGTDAVSIRDRAHHVWFDHNDISDGSDGNLDIVAASDFVTISWNKFYYSTLRSTPGDWNTGHRFSNLVGADDNVVTDEGSLNVTFHHNWWADNVNQRMPRVRYGKIHVFNNLYTATGNTYCIGVGMAADVRSENNVFLGVQTPINITNYSDPRSLATSTGNIYTDTTGIVPADLGEAFTPAYEYSLDPAEDVESAVRSAAGPS